MKRFRCTTETAFYKDRAFALQGVMVEDPNGEYVLYEDVIAEENPVPECPFPMGSRVQSKKDKTKYTVVGWEMSPFSGRWCMKFEGTNKFWLPEKFELVPEMKTGICHECGGPMEEYIRASNWDPEWVHSDRSKLHPAVESRPEPPRMSVVLWNNKAWHRPAGVSGYRVVGAPLHFLNVPQWSEMYGATVLYEMKEDVIPE